MARRSQIAQPATASRGSLAATTSRIGPAMALGAGAVWSLGAVMTRLADNADAFQYLIWRSVGIIAVVEAWALLGRQPASSRRAFTSGRRMIAANAALLLASIGFIYAIKATSAANAAFLGSTGPLFGVLIARVALGERLTWRTAAAIALALLGLAVMFAGDLQAGAFTDELAGNLSALASAIGFACYTVIVRSRPERDWSPVLPGYGWMMIAICAAVTLADGNTLVPPAGDVTLALIHGGGLIVGGTLLYNWASRHVAAAAMTVFAQTEMVLVPVWGFLLLSERPTGPELVGGAIILFAVVGKAVLDARDSRVPDPLSTLPAPT